MITLSSAQARKLGGGNEAVHLIQFAGGCRNIPQGDYTAHEFSAALQGMNLSPAQQVVIFDLVNLEDIDDTSLKVLMQLNQTHIVRFVVKSVALRHKMQAAANAADKPINIRTDLAHALC